MSWPSLPERFAILTASTAFSFPRTRCIPGSPFRMADDVLDAYVQQLIESQREPQVTIAWQGGEPTLMGLDFFRRAMTLVHKYKRPGNDSGTHYSNQRYSHE